jgi:ribosomal protein L21E
MKKMSKGQKKVGKVMKEFKKGKLHSGKSGKIVKNPKQAIAIALSEAKMSKKEKNNEKKLKKKKFPVLLQIKCFLNNL